MFFNSTPVSKEYSVIYIASKNKRLKLEDDRVGDKMYLCGVYNWTSIIKVKKSMFIAII